MIPKHRPHPTSPGEMLLEEFLVPMEMTQRALAEELGLSVPKRQLDHQRQEGNHGGNRGSSFAGVQELTSVLAWSANGLGTSGTPNATSLRWGNGQSSNQVFCS